MSLNHSPAAPVVSVKRAENDDTVCRRCDRPIRRGQRIVLLAGVGNTHLRCLVVGQADETAQELTG